MQAEATTDAPTTLDVSCQPGDALVLRNHQPRRTHETHAALVIGAIGTAGLIAMAAPASADTNTTLQQTVQSTSTTFTDSIDPGKAVNEFLDGNCNPNGCPEKDMNPGVLHQFDVFRQSLQGQSKTFGDSVDPTKQLSTFAKSITNQSDPAKN